MIFLKNYRRRRRHKKLHRSIEIFLPVSSFFFLSFIVLARGVLHTFGTTFFFFYFFFPIDRSFGRVRRAYIRM